MRTEPPVSGTLCLMNNIYLSSYILYKVFFDDLKSYHF